MRPCRCQPTLHQQKIVESLAKPTAASFLISPCVLWPEWIGGLGLFSIRLKFLQQIIERRSNRNMHCCAGFAREQIYCLCIEVHGADGHGEQIAEPQPSAESRHTHVSP